MMLSKSEERKLRRAETNIDLSIRQLKSFWWKIWSKTKLELRHMKNSMMYGKKSKNKFDRTWNEIIWFLKIVFIFFALKGLTYWLTGR